MPDPGDFFVVATHGGWRVNLISTLIRWDTSSPVNHAGIYIGNSQIIEARPSGAGYSSVTAYPDAIWSNLPLTTGQRTSVVTWAEQQQGVGYSWLDIACIAFTQKRWANGALRHTWLWKLIARRVSNDGRLICSQLVDAAYDHAGVHLFQDGRLEGSVAPGDLYDLIAPPEA